ANGRVRRDKDSHPDSATVKALGPFWSQYADRNQIFANEGKGRFHDISPQNPVFCGTAAVGRGLAWADLDGDGAIDLVATYVGGHAKIFRNVAPKQGHWLMIRALDPALHRDASGAEITLHTAGRRWWGMINPGSSYLCSNDPRAHFGLGPVDRIDSLTVIWPDGTEETFAGCKADQTIVIRKGGGRHERE